MSQKTYTPPGTSKSFPVMKTAIESIKQDLFVREKLDDDRVWYWVERFQNDPDSVDPIEITQNFSLTDGRHRIAAAELCDLKVIDTYTFPVKTRQEQIQRAFLSNVNPDSPKPPTKADAIVTAKQMIAEKAKRQDIIDMLAKMFPVATAKGLYDEARHGIYRDNIRDAKRAVLDDGKPLPEAAKEFGIDVEKLREEMGGGKKRKAKLGPGDFNRELSTQYRSHGQKIRAIFARVDRLYQEGEFSKAAILEIYDYAISSAKQRLRDLTDRRARIDSK